MKTPAGFLLMIMIAFATLANSLLPSNTANSLTLVGTATKTPTKKPVQTTRTPAGQSAIPIVHFDRSLLSTVAPADILKEVNYGGAFGGPSYDITMEFTTNEPVLCPKGLSKPVIVKDPLDRTSSRGSRMDTCGWEQGRKLMGRIFYPNGSVFGETIAVVGREGKASLFFGPSNSDPTGVYTYEIRSQEIVLTSNADFRVSHEPRVSAVSKNQFLLEDFLPNQTVRIFAYTCTGTPRGTRPCYLYGWTKYMLPEDGRMIIQINDLSMFYQIVDSYGHEFQPDRYGMHYEIGNLTKIVGEHPPALLCPPRIYRITSKDSINRITKARVIADSPGIKLYANPRATARVVTVLNVDQLVDFMDVGTPICNEGKVWWRVSTINGAQGFVVEFDGSDYYIQPVKSQ